MPSWFQSPLSRLLAAILAFLASPISASAWAISGGSTRSPAVKRIETRANPRNTILCPTYGADTQPIILEGRIEGDQTVCEYPYLDTLYVLSKGRSTASAAVQLTPPCSSVVVAPSHAGTITPTVASSRTLTQIVLGRRLSSAVAAAVEDVVAEAAAEAGALAVGAADAVGVASDGPSRIGRHVAPVQPNP